MISALDTVEEEGDDEKLKSGSNTSETPNKISPQRAVRAKYKSSNVLPAMYTSNSA